MLGPLDLEGKVKKVTQREKNKDKVAPMTQPQTVSFALSCAYSSIRLFVNSSIHLACLAERL